MVNNWYHSWQGFSARWSVSVVYRFNKRSSRWSLSRLQSVSWYWYSPPGSRRSPVVPVASPTLHSLPPDHSAAQSTSTTWKCCNRQPETRPQRVWATRPSKLFSLSSVVCRHMHSAHAATARSHVRAMSFNQSHSAHLFITPTRVSDGFRPTYYWAFTRYDRRTDRSVRLVCPTGRSDDRIV